MAVYHDNELRMQSQLSNGAQTSYCHNYLLPHKMTCILLLLASI